MRVGVIGAGSWGTALACLVAGKEPVVLWGRDPERMARMGAQRENEKYLSGTRFPDSLKVTADLADLADCEEVILAVPTTGQVAMARLLLEAGRPSRVLCAAKGYEPDTDRRMSVALADTLGPGVPVGVLAGPSHAEEVARGIPTTVVVSAQDEATSLAWQTTLMSPTFRVYTNPDLVGVETAAALKNVIAIAAGICDGLGFGDNTKGALLTRGLAEIARLGEALGAAPETFSGLAGLGDLVTTCMSRHSRNRRVGEFVAQGKTTEQARAETGMVAEGVATTAVALRIAEAAGVEVPITFQVGEVLFGGKPPRRALEELMERDAKPEVR
ncbi:MAG: NAD(P)-dependent glycerol-3-phosphate dehydrogenase [Gemmatimonadetes bacterium]|nr:NAD(P)-dependent glycerol-3-phosphate dehydrogenase [Gemmatimonadota bacterium]